MLQSHKIFIDTQYFVRAGLNFQNSALISFKNLCEQDLLSHVTTSVVTKEVKRKIEQSIKDALTARQTFKRKASILASIDDEQTNSLFIDIDENEIHQKAITVFNNFISSCKTIIVDSKNIDTEELLDIYFNQRPPFSDGKKSEFPDAISLLSLQSHLNESEKIYIVSDDNDLKEFCKNDVRFIAIESLDKMLDIYSEHSNKLTSAVKEYISKSREKLCSKIKTCIENADVFNSSSWEDSEVEDLHVIDIGEIDPSVIYISDEECKITFEVEIEYMFIVSGPDFNNGIYDREDGRTYTFNTTTHNCQTKESFIVEINLSYQFIDGSLHDILEDDIYIPDLDGGLELSIEENDFEWS